MRAWELHGGLGGLLILTCYASSMPSRTDEKRRASNRKAAERRRRKLGVPLKQPGLTKEEERLRGIAYAIAYRHANRDRVNEWRRQHLAKKRLDPQYRVIAVLRSRLSQAVGRTVNKPMSTLEGLGCTFAELKQKLEAQFQDGMSWENYGRKGWHIDHRKPLALFDLTDPAQFRKACHYSNLQPLWWHENVAKGARYTG